MTLQKLPLGKILDIQKNPIINRHLVLSFLLGILCGVGIGFGIATFCYNINAEEIPDDLISLPIPSPISPD